MRGVCLIEKAAISIDEMSEQLGITRSQAYEIVKRKDFPCIRIGRRIIIPTVTFKEWLVESSKKQIKV